ncbi:proton-translocating transhydrogenase family protein [Pseudonocardia sp.]|jgi:NAD(P) transhydrogenase subunit alpha|uniref:proton-translocating transhydrogenase family protein n=1 Tax=Pseudonocardia sp. TaxID=60912 RepID=UPI0029FD3F22|nr:transhydrogenase alpha subunit-like [Pseudonocardia sp.]
MTPLLFADITIFVLSLLVGFEIISKVPATLHTPLMSGSNAVHGVVVVGVMVLAAVVNSPLGYVLLLVAAAFAAMNVVGGYVVTDRMLEMFRARPARIEPKADER